MKERPILFSGPMVRAILAGKKTQTRRIVKFPPNFNPTRMLYRSTVDRKFTFDEGPQPDNSPFPFIQLAPRYGEEGDRLWVREEHYRFGHWEPVEGVRTKTGRQKWRFVSDSKEVLFDPPTRVEIRKSLHHKDPKTRAWHKRLARFMPREFSRITLEITGVRVERVRDIFEEDAEAEGIEPEGDNWKSYEIIHSGKRKGEPHPHAIVPNRSPVTSFIELWESINGPGSWAANPWVWVIEFKRVAET